MTYQPSRIILERYADLLVNYALNGGKGIKKGEVVFLEIPECAKPLLVPLRNAVLKSGGHPMINFSPDEISKEFYDLADETQLKFFPDKFLKGKVDQADHSITIIATTNKKELEKVHPKKIMARSHAFKQYSQWREEKENNGKFTWTLALYGTEAMAKEANLSLEEYWNQIISACYLDNNNPVKKWKDITSEVERVKRNLNKLKIQKLRIEGKDTDLIVGLGDDRVWLGGSGRNIPSFEVFISPHCRQTEGHIKFNQPLYRYGNLIKDVYLEFKNGKVIKAKASKGEKVLKEMIATPGADMIGEFSLTDSRLSRITKFMAETLFDENTGGKYGNTHLALGNAYKTSYYKDPSKVKKNDWKKLGFNESSVHTDIIQTEDRTVTAFLKDGSQKVIYKDGKFVI